jgi:hypothetical protein
MMEPGTQEVDMIDWLMDNKDLLAVGLALLGIILALYTAGTNRHQRRRDALYRIHELLTSSDQQRGRRLLYDAARTGRFPALDSEDFATMNRAIVTLDAVGLYVRRRIVPRRWVLDVWHHPFADIRPAAEAFIAHRSSRHVNTGWRAGTDMEDLLDQAARFRTRRRCCTGSPQRLDEAPPTLVGPQGQDEPAPV